MLLFFDEPTLKDLLSDPIVQAIMQSDKVKPRDLCRLLRDARNSRRAPSTSGRDE